MALRGKRPWQTPRASSRSGSRRRAKWVARSPSPEAVCSSREIGEPGILESAQENASVPLSPPFPESRSPRSPGAPLKHEAKALQISINCGPLIIVHVIEGGTGSVATVGRLLLGPRLEARPLLQCDLKSLSLGPTFRQAKVRTDRDHSVLPIPQRLPVVPSVVSITLHRRLLPSFLF